MDKLDKLEKENEKLKNELKNNKETMEFNEILNKNIYVKYNELLKCKTENTENEFKLNKFILTDGFHNYTEIFNYMVEDCTNILNTIHENDNDNLFYISIALNNSADIIKIGLTNNPVLLLKRCILNYLETDPNEFIESNTKKNITRFIIKCYDLSNKLNSSINLNWINKITLKYDIEELKNWIKTEQENIYNDE
jgi:hypothetical protein